MAKVKATLPADTPVEIWFQDEARIGQKNKITRRWARRGTRPCAPKDQRTKSAYIFGAICPEHGKGAGLVLPLCNTEAMTLHLAEIAIAIAPGAHAVVLMDQAGWHMTGKLNVPDNIRGLRRNGTENLHKEFQKRHISYPRDADARA